MDLVRLFFFGEFGIKRGGEGTSGCENDLELARHVGIHTCWGFPKATISRAWRSFCGQRTIVLCSVVGAWGCAYACMHASGSHSKGVMLLTGTNWAKPPRWFLSWRLVASFFVGVDGCRATSSCTFVFESAQKVETVL